MKFDIPALLLARSVRGVRCTVPAAGLALGLCVASTGMLYGQEEPAPAVAPIPAKSTPAGEDPVRESPPSDEAMPPDAARTRALNAMAAKTDDAAERAAVEAVWADVTGETAPRRVHDRFATSLAIVDPAWEQLVAGLNPADPPLFPPESESVLATASDPFVAVNERLFVARLLTDMAMYDEALPLLDAAVSGPDFSLAIDPATAIFCKAVCEHQEAKIKEGLTTLDRLDAVPTLPERYRALAKLMRRELADLDPESLENVARMMRGVERRLKQGRGDEKTEDQEGKIVEGLDRMIEKIEQQMQQSSSQGNQPGNSNQPNAPAGESVVKGATAPGEADSKTVGRAGGWGDMPPREREAAKNAFDEQFGGKHSELSEKYFAKRARAAEPRD